MNPDFDSDFEAQLSRMRPTAPSAGLKERIGAQLAAQMRSEAVPRQPQTQEHVQTSAVAPAVSVSDASAQAADNGTPAPAPKPSRWKHWEPAEDRPRPWFTLGWTRWLAPAGACILLIIISLPRTELRPPDLLAALPEASVFTEVPLQTEVSLVYQDDHTPMKVTRTSSQASYTWKDPDSQSEITTTFPREDIVISQVDTH